MDGMARYSPPVRRRCSARQGRPQRLTGVTSRFGRVRSCSCRGSTSVLASDAGRRGPRSGLTAVAGRWRGCRSTACRRTLGRRGRCVRVARDRIHGLRGHPAARRRWRIGDRLVAALLDVSLGHDHSLAAGRLDHEQGVDLLTSYPHPLARLDHRSGLPEVVDRPDLL